MPTTPSYLVIFKLAVPVLALAPENAQIILAVWRRSPEFFRSLRAGQGAGCCVSLIQHHKELQAQPQDPVSAWRVQCFYVTRWLL